MVVKRRSRFSQLRNQNGETGENNLQAPGEFPQERDRHNAASLARQASCSRGSAHHSSYQKAREFGEAVKVGQCGKTQIARKTRKRREHSDPAREDTL
jgi:hypothetical protein